MAGRRRADAPDLVETDDSWHLGSNTEAMTAVVYARLVEERQAIWHASVGLLFPDLHIDPAWADTTIESFLSHRAGVSDVGVIDEGWLIKTHHDKRSLPDQRTAMAARILGQPPTGSKHDYEYANADYVIAGAAIERITRTSWEIAVSSLVFQPLGLSSAGFGAPLGDEPWGHDFFERRRGRSCGSSQGVSQTIRLFWLLAARCTCRFQTM